MKPIKIREAKKKDLNTLASIEAEAFSNPIYDEFRLNKKEIQAELKDKDIKTLVVKFGNTVAGYVMVDIAKEDPSAANIDSLAIDSKFTGKGLDVMLLTAAAEVAVKKGFDKMTIQEPESATDTLKLLRREGYRKTDEISGFYNAPAEQANGLELTKVLVTKKEAAGKTNTRKVNAI